jgi:signal peptidase I
MCVAVIAAGLLAGCGGGKDVTVVLTTASSPTLSPVMAYKVPSGSMEPTLGIGARVAVTAEQPKIGDIVVFYPPEGAQQEQCGPVAHTVELGGAACTEPLPQRSSVKFIKRIIAGSGDEIYVKEGHVFRRTAGSDKFVREQDPYIRECGASAECNFLTPIRIPVGDWFLMGDNRGESDDSRFWGPVPTSWIVGVVTSCATHPSSRRTLGQQMSIRACRLPK